MEIIHADNLTFKYKTTDENNFERSHTALDEIEIHTRRGEFIAILGRNGSGKSTLAKHMNALLVPSSGIMLVNGLDTADEAKTWDIRRSSGMVFQNPDNQLIATIVEEDIAFGPENLGVPPEKIRQDVDAALAAVNMTPYRRAEPRHLSGGQKQRVAIAGILAMKPDCIVLDEPTAMLDPSGRKEVIGTVARLNKEEGISVILITHFMEEAVQADRVIVMDKGRVVMDGTPREVFSRVGELKALHLDVPMASEIVHKLIDEDFALPKNILTIDELTDALRPFKPQVKDLRFASAREEEKIFGNPASGDPASGNPVLEVKNVSFIYNQGAAYENKALDNVSLAIRRGEFVGLIGHTGSGKSTLIQTLNALLKPTSGSIYFNGMDINADRKKLRGVRQRVGLVFQYPEHQLFEMTVIKDVLFGPENMGLPEKEARERAEQALAACGITDDAFEKSPFDLSGGQKRRAAIAGVLAMRPEVLILDEPAAGLDPRGRDGILKRVKKMRESFNITVILVSHSMEDVAELADRVVVMNKGRVEFDGPPGEIFSRGAELEAMGLAAPQAAHLAQRLKSEGWPLNGDIFTARAAYEGIRECLKTNNNGGMF